MHFPEEFKSLLAKEVSAGAEAEGDWKIETISVKSSLSEGEDDLSTLRIFSGRSKESNCSQALIKSQKAFSKGVCCTVTKDDEY